MRLVNESTGVSVSISKKSGETVNLYWTDGLDDDDDGPDDGGTDHGYGEYGDSWPGQHNQGVIMPGDRVEWDRGRVNNNKSMTNTTLVGFTFDAAGSDFALKLTNCGGQLADPDDPTSWPTLDIVGCTFTNARQGFKLNWDSDHTDSQVLGLHVRFFDCRFVDNYAPGLVGLPAEVGAYHNARGTRSLIGFYGCTFLNTGYDGTEHGRLTDASIYDHPVYPKGNPDIEAIDCLFVRSSGQAFKGIGSSVLFKRCAVVDSAVGFGIGLDREQQDRTGRHDTTGLVEGCVFYGLTDVPVNNQRLGWGLVFQSCDIDVVGNVITTPRTESDKRPAIRFNRVRDYPVTIRMTDNVVLGYRHVVESYSDRAWTASVSGTGTTVGLGTVFAHERGDGLVAGSLEMTETGQPLPVLDVDAIAAGARDGSVRADDVIGLVRGQIDE